MATFIMESVKLYIIIHPYREPYDITISPKTSRSLGPLVLETPF